MDSDLIIERLSKLSSDSATHIRAVIDLLKDGATVPFIARYRKEATGSMDEVQIRHIQEQYSYIEQLEKRRESIRTSLQHMGITDPHLLQAIEQADQLSRLEDLYIPFKPKKKTRAMRAREIGLQPFADLILEQHVNLQAAWLHFKSNHDTPLDFDTALKGAQDIIAEWIAEHADYRNLIRSLYQRTGRIKSSVIRGMEAQGSKFQDYFEWSENLNTCPSHRMLAMRRGESENVLILDFYIDHDAAVEKLEALIINKNSMCREAIKPALKDGYKRLLQPAIETEIRILSKQQADTQAIKVFAENLKALLLAPPMGGKRVLALDPGFKSGCKLVVLGNEGQLLEDTVIFPHEPFFKKTDAGYTVLALASKFDIEAIAIGNGTASRETEQFIRQIDGLPKHIPVIVVSEAGASVYSASDIARDEFPNKDLTVRGAVSIGRRLCDPLAELVKIDPKSIGVGQYQHDVDAQKLKKALDDVVESCVNAVGVELNTASASLLAYVSGIGPQLAQHIVSYRNVHGSFKNRDMLKSIPRLGNKAYEQCAGFLRIQHSEQILDRSGVHPERYALVTRMAEDSACTVSELMQSAALRKKINLQHYISESVGMPTLIDILKELENPGRDPRKPFEVFAFDEHVHQPEDLKPGMVLPGVVSNVTRFGAFVDIGVHQDGLIHVSQLSDQYVEDAMRVVKVGDTLTVKILEIDLSRKRIALTLKGIHEKQQSQKKTKITEPVVTDMNLALQALKNKFKTR
ncbi:MAG: RNA-binding transcriptional accessory protein [Bacteroidia bacterium]|nr:RNA-binding transcriptional accessory protein [Bacteroidia bacterium]